MGNSLVRNLTKVWAWVENWERPYKACLYTLSTLDFFNSRDKVVSQPSRERKSPVTWEIDLLLLGGQRGQGFRLAQAVS